MPLTPPRRTTKDYFLPFFIIIAIGAIAVLSMRLLGQMSEDSGSDMIFGATSGEAALNVKAGEVEAYLPAAEAWKIVAKPGTTLNSGEKVRTSKDGAAYLVLDDGTRITLAPSTELSLDDLKNTFRKKIAKLTLSRGSVWIDTTKARKGELSLDTRILQMTAPDGMLLLRVEDDGAKVDLSVVTGVASAIVVDPQKDARRTDLKRVVVEAGQTLGLTERRVNLIRIGGEIDLVKDTPKEIKASDFYVAQALNVVVENKEGLDSGQPSIDNKQQVVTDSSSSKLTAPVITSVKDGEKVMIQPVELRGTVGSLTTKVEVTASGGTPYILGGYRAGDKNFIYRAKIAFGNLQEGQNTYSVVAIDADGNRSPATTVMIEYSTQNTADNNQSKTTKEDGTSGVPVVGGKTFGAPVVVAPVDGETVAVEPVAFSGTVPDGTEAVEVNGYRLTSFHSGDTTWRYNAKTEYENLQPGENKYEIEAISETGDKSSVTIKIYYKPKSQ